MSAAEKFDFGQSFDADSETGPHRPAAKFTEDDMAGAREEGFAAGREAGMAAARESAELRIAELLSALSERIDGLIADMEKRVAANAREAQELAMLVCRKLMPTLAERNALVEIEGLIGTCLDQLVDEPRVVIRVDDANLPILQQHIERITESAVGFTGKLVLFADETMGATNCAVLWADGGAERDVPKLTQDIEQVVSRHLDESPLTPPPAPAEADPTAATDEVVRDTGPAMTTDAVST